MVKNDKLLSDIAKERINRLVELAKARTIKMGTPDQLSKKYMNIATSLKNRYGLREANPRLKEAMCKTCGSVLVHGFNSTVRISGQNRYKIITCSRCGTEKHISF